MFVAVGTDCLEAILWCVETNTTQKVFWGVWNDVPEEHRLKARKSSFINKLEVVYTEVPIVR